MTTHALDLDALDPRRRAWLEEVLAAGAVLVRDAGRVVGTLTYSPAVLDGTVVVKAPPTGGATPSGGA